ncbi:DoxX family protein [Nocardioides limicola]|uniref:DoxX family protein n=1 Tax=Nocardioides limicola TaxID=2803368 RepID=UPI00193C4D94|nr:DoxX family protein [Nocardioides sp. DJM-14]
MSTVQILLLVLGALIALLLLGAGISKVSGQPAMRESADHFSIAWSRYRLIGFAEVAAAIGIVVGIWVNGLGLAAGIAVVALMLGAVGFHVRFRDGVKATVPALIALAVAGGFVTVQAVAIWG